MVLGALLFSGILSKPASAQTASGNFQVLINITKQCLVTATTNMDFGNSGGVITTALNQQSTITVTCTGTTPYTVGLNAGATSGATVTTRQMSNGGTDRINYALYSDAGRTTNWGNTTGTWVSGTGTGLPQILTVYGQVPVQTATAVGAYTDTIAVTVTY